MFLFLKFSLQLFDLLCKGRRLISEFLGPLCLFQELVVLERLLLQEIEDKLAKCCKVLLGYIQLYNLLRLDLGNS